MARIRRRCGAAPRRGALRPRRTRGAARARAARRGGGGAPVKRLCDLAGSLVLLALLSPVLAVIALAIVIDSRGPVFYRQERIGRGGAPFRIFKFRTMVVDAEHKGLGLAVAADDERITRVGRVLRRWSLDELPQLLNVVAGDMSIVGPRPTVASQVERYDDFQRRRLEALPGITGWAQVNGRNDLPWERRIEFDVWYVDHRSLARDFVILMRTPAALLGKRGVYGGDGVTKDLGE
ncbi:MAG: sugar transferase [Actinobacteria bacterium]|nr:MAG: sugar transferase [Actinomycetota bacterium]